MTVCWAYRHLYLQLFANRSNKVVVITNACFFFQIVEEVISGRWLASRSPLGQQLEYFEELLRSIYIYDRVCVSLIELCLVYSNTECKK